MITRPCKKRKLIKKMKEAEIYGVEARLENLRVGGDGERRRRRAKDGKKKEETLEQKLKTKFCHHSLKPWQRAEMAQTFPQEPRELYKMNWHSHLFYLQQIFVSVSNLILII